MAHTQKIDTSRKVKDADKIIKSEQKKLIQRHIQMYLY